MARRQLRELWHGGQTRVIGVGGVDAADQRIDQSIVDLVAEACPDQRTERVVGIGARQQRLGGGPQLARPAQQRGGDERSHRGRNAEHDATGDRVHAVVPDHRRGVGRRGHVAARQPDLACKCNGVRDAGEIGVGPLVDVCQPAERRGGDHPAQPSIGLPQLDIEPVGVAQPGGSGETGDAATDDERPTIAHTCAIGSASSWIRDANAAITAGSSLTHAVRAKARPCDSARWRASMSRSYSTSR